MLTSNPFIEISFNSYPIRSKSLQIIIIFALMVDLYLLNGSNVGDRFRNLNEATDMLSQVFSLPLAKSSIYETQAWGKENQQNFYNQALHFIVEDEPENILITIKKIEATIGSKHQERWSARKIDIDLIFYGDLIYQSDSLHIPHRLMHLRNFVLYPLNEIAPNFVHPQMDLTIQQLLQHSSDDLKVQKITTINEI